MLLRDDLSVGFFDLLIKGGPVGAGELSSAGLGEGREFDGDFVCEEGGRFRLGVGDGDAHQAGIGDRFGGDFGAECRFGNWQIEALDEGLQNGCGAD